MSDTDMILSRPRFEALERRIGELEESLAAVIGERDQACALLTEWLGAWDGELTNLRAKANIFLNSLKAKS